MADLDAASLDDVREWFSTYYGAANAVLVLAGDIDVATARAKAERYFGHIAPGPALTRPGVCNVVSNTTQPPGHKTYNRQDDYRKAQDHIPGSPAARLRCCVFCRLTRCQNGRLRGVIRAAAC
jgi:predicted Zn-dependent peptidase